MKKTVVALAIIFLAGFASAYTQAEFQDSMRLGLEPGHLQASLPTNTSPIVTSVTNNVLVKLGGATNLNPTVMNDFSYDVVNDRFYFTRAATDVWFSLTASLSYSLNVAPSSETTIYAAKNGVMLTDIRIERTISGSGVKGVVILAGRFQVSENDYVELYVLSGGAGTHSFSAAAFATDIKEDPQ